MAEQPSFCTKCGQPIGPGVSFCSTCGSKVIRYPGATTAVMSQPVASQIPQKRKRPSILLILIGILFILVGLIGPAALVFGKTTSAEITNVEQQIDNSSDRMDYNYQITYLFTVDGKRQTGSYNMNKVYNVASLPSTGSSLMVKYIPGLLFINSPANQSNPGITLLLACGLGVLLIILGAKGRVNVHMRRK